MSYRTGCVICGHEVIEGWRFEMLPRWWIS